MFNSSSFRYRQWGQLLPVLSTSGDNFCTSVRHFTHRANGEWDEFSLAGGATQLSWAAAIYISLPISLLSVSYTIYNGLGSLDAISHLIYRTFYHGAMAPVYRRSPESWGWN